MECRFGGPGRGFVALGLRQGGLAGGFGIRVSGLGLLGFRV